MPENWGEKLIISSDSGYVSNILTLPSIICADKRSGGCKISSRYFSKMLSTPRYRTYRPIPSIYKVTFRLKFQARDRILYPLNTSPQSVQYVTMKWIQTRHHTGETSDASTQRDCITDRGVTE